MTDEEIQSLKAILTELKTAKEYWRKIEDYEFARP